MVAEQLGPAEEESVVDTPTKRELIQSLVDAVCHRYPDLSEEIQESLDLIGEDVENIIGAITTLLEKHGIDISSLAELIPGYESSEPIPAEPPREHSLTEEVSGSGEQFQRQRFATACEGILSTEDRTSLLHCGFYAPEEGEPFEHSIYRCVVWMIAREHVLPAMDQSAIETAKKKDRPRIKKTFEQQALATATQLLADKGIANPGIEF